RFEPYRLERPEPRRQIARQRGARNVARTPVRPAVDDLAHLAECHPPVEQDIGRQTLRNRLRPVLEREHHEHECQRGWNEGRAVDPGLDHGSNVQFRLTAPFSALARVITMEMAATRPRILLVDDEPRVRQLLSYPLERDFEVVQAFDGEEALRKFREGEFDLVLLDLMLPKKNGLDVCRELREKSTVPIIMLTAKAEESDKVYGLELGADDYITKPFSTLELRSRVRALLRRTGSGVSQV